MITRDDLGRTNISSTRRQWLAGFAVTASALTLGTRDVWAAGDNGVSHSAEAIHQEVF